MTWGGWGRVIGDLRPDETVGVLCVGKRTAAACFLTSLGRARRTVLLDAHDGTERVRENIERAGVDHLLVDACAQDRLSPVIDRRTSLVPEDPRGGRPTRAAQFTWSRVSADAEYGLFTSGSTGVPSLVVQTLGSVMALADGYVAMTGISEDDTIAVWGSQAHDAFVFDLVTSLICGARLEFLDMRLIRPGALPGRLASTDVTVWHSVPTVWRAMMSRCPSLVTGHPRLIVLGGEATSPQDLALVRHSAPQARVFSLYGRSEISAVSGHFLAGEAECGLLGAELPGVEIGVRGSDGEVQLDPESGVSGELLVRSRSHARVIGPGAVTTLHGWCATGDVVRGERSGWRFVGRQDDVVNLNGNRISLDEIDDLVQKVTGARDALAFVMDRGVGAVGLGVLVDADRQWSVPELNAATRSAMPSGAVLRQVRMCDIRANVGRTGKADRTAQRRVAQEEVGRFSGGVTTSRSPI